MKFKIKIFLIIIAISFPLFLSASNNGDTCFKCHKKSKFITGASVHKPVKGKKCILCHMPHVSKFDKLLNISPDELCNKCHKKLFKEANRKKFKHPPFTKKACIRCHNSHSSNFAYLLKKNPAKLCVSCHKKLEKSFKYSHQPFKKGKCLSCHSAHASNDLKFLKKQGSKICLTCHKISDKLKKKHKMNFTQYNCLSCHNPHGSSEKSLLRKISHNPYAANKCNSCHNKNNNRELCLQCHKKVLSSFDKIHNHLLGGESKNSCLICHSPHAGDTNALLKDAPKRLCQDCHFETYSQKHNSLYVHPQWDQCIDCHNAHGEDNVAMLKGGGNKSCSSCHETQGKFTHPVGEKFKDPRNGQTITCITCHNTMGTNFKYNLKLSGEGELCLECHKNY